MKSKWYEIKALADDVTEVLIYGEIGKSWDGSGISARDFVMELDGITSAKINLRINSGGGEVFEGAAIANAIKRCAADVSVIVDGLAASSASMIALSGNSLTMAANSFMMIHDPWTWAMGNADELMKQAELLDKLAGKMAQLYAEKCGKPAEQMRAAMKSETWYTAEEAKAVGLCDSIGDEGKGIDGRAVAIIMNSKSAPKALRRLAASIDRNPSGAELEQARANFARAMREVEQDTKAASA
jgi:ATP-dependent Clp protease, protease subunit